MKRRATRQKTCKSCKLKFTPDRQMQSVCSPLCAIKMIDKRKEKENLAAKRDERRRLKEQKEKVKSLAQLLKEAESVVNRYVRLRDHHLGCCSCDKPKSWGGQWHASHYRSVGSSPHLRFNLHNIHKGCSQCNNYRSGNIGEYRIRLIARFGLDYVESLENNNEIRRYTPEYARRIKAVFAKRCKILEKRIKAKFKEV